ncbi:ANTAR domain-containing protein [Streptomyces sp. McG3]|uniref:ANTAR domain-containing protein n=1 Tax=unclassified Streptomyces TaxID=2593676 RepID=UPI001BE84333|nr:ANTAR domain-containing protein [Streptomyces sp. McG3]MBT2899995.1 ANTAR domain-containing protein [Streptomyces sp. McG3]
MNFREDHERHAEVSREPQGAEQEVIHLRREVDGLRRALQTRPMIDVALGMVMATEGCSLDEAWEIMVHSSQRTNTKLHTLALRLTESSASPVSLGLPHSAPPAPSRSEEASGNAAAPDHLNPVAP